MHPFKNSSPFASNGITRYTRQDARYLLHKDVLLSSRFLARVNLALLGLSLASPVFAWDPDAGLIKPLTTGATLTATSPGSNLTNVLDGSTDTAWQSGACLPTGYMARPELNPILGMCATGQCSSSGSTNLKDATDNNPYTGAYVPAKNGLAWIEVPLPQARPLYKLGVRVFGSQPIVAEAVTANGKILFKTLTTTDNYKDTLTAAPGDTIISLRVSSTATFTVTELSTLAEPCFEAVTVDLGQSKPVGWIQMKHWSPDSTNITMSISNDGQSWSTIANLDPKSLSFASTRFPEQPVRYIKVRHAIVERDWAKVYAWEIAPYDANGPYGPPPQDKPNPHPMAELLGINGIWGWGSSKYSSSLTADQGPGLHSKFSSHARNYHNLRWDITDPDHIPDYVKMAAGKGTEGQWWLNWDTEYGAWVKAGLEVTASIQFTNRDFPMSMWDNPYIAAYNYGYAFAQHFGPIQGTGHITAMEIGNEPWDYPANFYSTVLSGMAAGAKAANPAMKVMPAALQAYKPEPATATSGNYIGARLASADAPNIDILNTHAYSFSYTSAGTRIAVPPEHPASSLNEVRNFLRFRDANLPNKPVYLTEWGWDSTGVGETCANSECVSEQAQAVYGVRGAFMFARWGLDRLTWFFYANDAKCNTLFCRSGVTGSVNVGFAPKRSFIAFQALANTLGNKRFLKVLREDTTAWIYLLGDASGKPTHIVAWRPVDGNDPQTTTVSLPVNDIPQAAWTLAGLNTAGEGADLPTISNGEWQLSLTATPLVITLASGL